MKRVQERVIRLEQAAGICMMALLFVIVNLGILSRYVFGHPISWIEEVSNFLFIWFGFLACSCALAQKRHILIDIFIHGLPDRLKVLIRCFLGLLLQLLFAWMLWPSIKAIKEFQLSSALKIPEGYVFLVVPLSFGLFSFHNLLALISDFNSLKTHFRKAGESR
jgi:TRAP-type C4-dicarboxylate transport system permease small subunit